jgi:hypothetical protein
VQFSAETTIPCLRVVTRSCLLELERERVVGEAEAARFLGVSPETVKRLADSGRLNRLQISPRRVAYKVKELLARTAA